MEPSIEEYIIPSRTDGNWNSNGSAGMVVGGFPKCICTAIVVAELLI